jgi:hypothetical protein
MANVGNLFVNFSGNTKGLTKSLSSAKSQIDKFDKEIGRKKGGSLGRAKGRFTSSMNERRRFDSKVGVSNALGFPMDEGHVIKNRARLGKNEKGARQAYRQAQREQTISGMRKSVAAAVGVFGLTVAGIGLLTRKAMQQTSDAVSNAKKFEFMGPNGPAIIAERIKMITDAMAYAQTPEGNAAQLKLARSETAAQRSSLSGGGATMMQMFNAAVNEAAATIGRVWVETAEDMAAGRFLGQGANRRNALRNSEPWTGPIPDGRNANRPTGGY